MDPVGVGSALGNLVTSSSFAVAGFAALSMAILPSRVPHPLPAHLAFLAGAALIFLAADEGLELHDRVGRWLYHERGIAAPGPINHIDDLIVFGYIVVAGVAGVIALPALLRSPRFFGWLIAAGALCAAGAAIDAFGTPGSWTEVPEEGFEAAGAVLFGAVFAVEASKDVARQSERPARLAAPTTM
jgi:hypothetical protein